MGTSWPPVFCKRSGTGVGSFTMGSPGSNRTSLSTCSTTPDMSGGIMTVHFHLPRASLVIRFPRRKWLRAENTHTSAASPRQVISTGCQLSHSQQEVFCSKTDRSLSPFCFWARSLRFLSSCLRISIASIIEANSSWSISPLPSESLARISSWAFSMVTSSPRAFMAVYSSSASIAPDLSVSTRVNAARIAFFCSSDRLDTLFCLLSPTKCIFSACAGDAGITNPSPSTAA
mmetsp:Transcript_59771/g.159972  ORF Transcript_59771/g.159972 Transcript_59771/m.159972 type:complete len:231 (+) Transcript_59771:1152-1844(+)